MRKMIGFILTLLSFLVGLNACNMTGDDGFTTDDSASSSIETAARFMTVSAVTDGSATVSIPATMLAVAGCPTSFSIDVVVGADTVRRIGPGDVLCLDSGRVVFTVSGLDDNDSVSFIITSENGQVSMYGGDLSASASIVAEDMDSASGDGVTTLPDSDSDEAITFGQMEDGKVIVMIPLDVFSGSTDIVEASTISISINGDEIASDLDVATYYHSSDEMVQFRLTSLEEGDEIGLTLVLGDGTTLSYAGFATEDGESTVYAD